MICQHGHNFDEAALAKEGVPSVMINEARNHHELGVCVELNTDQLVKDLMANARELWPEKYPKP